MTEDQRTPGDDSEDTLAQAHEVLGVNATSDAATIDQAHVARLEQLRQSVEAGETSEDDARQLREAFDHARQLALTAVAPRQDEPLQIEGRAIETPSPEGLDLAEAAARRADIAQTYRRRRLIRVGIITALGLGLLLAVGLGVKGFLDDRSADAAAKKARETVPAAVVGTWSAPGVEMIITKPGGGRFISQRYRCRSGIQHRPVDGAYEQYTVPGGSTCRVTAIRLQARKVKEKDVLTVVLNVEGTGRRDRINLQRG